MRVLVIAHHGEDSAGFVGDALEARGAKLATHVFPDDGDLPPVEDFAAAVVLGARWSVYDDATVGRWIGEEIDWLHRADSTGVAVLGICFGAQVLTVAFGGAVERAPAPEIGWTTVEPVGPLVVGPGPWFQFHYDRCALGPGAVLHARTGIAPQAFSIGRNLGLQFHPEVGADLLREWFEHGERELAQQAGLDPEVMLADTAAEEDAARGRAAELVSTFLERTRPGWPHPIPGASALADAP